MSDLTKRINDVPASLVVFLIALPLSMGIALASGVPPALGLVSAVIGGLVVGALGGAPLQVSGPAAGLAVLVLQMVGTHGMATFGVVVILAGLFQIAAGLMRLGRHFQAVSPAVVRGMLTGIGMLIILSQALVMFDESPRGGALQNLAAIPRAAYDTILGMGGRQHRLAALIGVGTLVSILAWEKWRPKRLKMVPGALLGAGLAAGAAGLLQLPIAYVALPADPTQLLQLPTFASMSALSESQVWIDAGALAFVATAQTLLTATAVARLHQGPRTDYDRELAVQGLANTICGGVGTIPICGVISRSSANVQANAQSRFSAVLHAIWIGAFVWLAPDLLALVPTCSLAAILIYVGFKLINVREIKKLRSYGRSVLGIFVATTLVVVAVDVLQGIVLGLLLSAARLIYKMSHVHFDLRSVDNRLELHMFGSASFLALPRLGMLLSSVPPERELHIYFGELSFIDHSCLDHITAFKERYEDAGGQVVVEWESLVGRYQLGEKTRSEHELFWSGRSSRPPPPPAGNSTEVVLEVAPPSELESSDTHRNWDAAISTEVVTAMEAANMGSPQNSGPQSPPAPGEWASDRSATLASELRLYQAISLSADLGVPWGSGQTVLDMAQLQESGAWCSDVTPSEPMLLLGDINLGSGPLSAEKFSADDDFRDTTEFTAGKDLMATEEFMTTEEFMAAEKSMATDRFTDEGFMTTEALMATEEFMTTDRFAAWEEFSVRSEPRAVDDTLEGEDQGRKVILPGELTSAYPAAKVPSEAVSEAVSEVDALIGEIPRSSGIRFVGHAEDEADDEERLPLPPRVPKVSFKS